MKIFKITLAVIATVLTTKSIAQQQNALSGKWALKEIIAISGPQYVNVLPENYTINLSADSIATTSTIGANITQGGNSLKHRNIFISDNQTVLSYAKWSDDHQVLIITSAISLQGDAKKTSFTRVKTLKIVGGELYVNLRSDENDPNNKSWETQAIYIRQ